MQPSEINNVHLLEKARDALAAVIAEFKPDTIDGHFLYTSSEFTIIENAHRLIDLGHEHIHIFLSNQQDQQKET